MCQEKIVNTSDFLFCDNHQGKVEAEATSFGLVCPVLPLVVWHYMIIWLSESMEESIDKLVILQGGTWD